MALRAICPKQAWEECLEHFGFITNRKSSQVSPESCPRTAKERTDQGRDLLRQGLFCFSQTRLESECTGWSTSFNLFKFRMQWDQVKCSWTDFSVFPLSFYLIYSAVYISPSVTSLPVNCVEQQCLVWRQMDRSLFSCSLGSLLQGITSAQILHPEYTLPHTTP